MLTPVGVPGVDTDPVRSAVVNAPADHLDGVTTEGLAGLVLVDTSGVGLEVLVDVHGNRDGALLHHLPLHVLNTLDGVGSLGELLIGLVRGGVGLVCAGRRALGSGVLVAAVDVLAVGDTGRGCHVVGAGLHGVRLAGASGSVVTTSGNTLLGEPLPGTSGLATIAAHGEAARQAAAARHGVLGGEEGGGVAGGDAVAVVEHLGGAESPARSAIRLIANVSDDVLMEQKGKRNENEKGQGE